MSKVPLSKVTAVLRRHDDGMTTAEYAVGTVAACGFGGVLYKLLTSETVASLLEDVITQAFNFIL